MLNKDYKEMLQLLLEERVEFMLVGAYAMGAHGYPRATGDIDIWVEASKNNATKVLSALKKFGAPLAQVSLQDFSQEGAVFQIGVTPRRIDIITKISGVTYQEANQDKATVNVEGLNIPVISLDKFVKNKLASGRDKDTIDVKYLMEARDKNSFRKKK